VFENYFNLDFTLLIMMHIYIAGF